MLHAAAIAIAKASSEATLLESEERLRLLSDNLPGGMIYQVVRESDGRMRFLYFSARVTQLNGVTPEAVLADPMTLYGQIHPDDAPRVAAAEGISLRTMSVFSVETRLRRADNEWRWMFLISAPRRLPDGRIVWDGIELDITERKETEDRLRLLSNRLMEIQESERRHLARELHDQIGQSLTVMKIHLQSAERFPDPATQAKRLGDAVSNVDRMLTKVRAMTLDLRPPLLDDLGLAPALRWLVNEQVTHADLKATFLCNESDERFHAEVEKACFRVAQEALTNVVRHSKSRGATVELRRVGADLLLAVCDEGVGFDCDAVRRRATRGGSMGLLGMEERTLLVGGKLQIESTPGKGTEIRAYFPAKPAASGRVSP